MEQIFSYYVSGDENKDSREPVVNDVTVLFSRVGFLVLNSLSYHGLP